LFRKFRDAILNSRYYKHINSLALLDPIGPVKECVGDQQPDSGGTDAGPDADGFMLVKGHGIV
jgi:hypothetical protein